MPGQVERAGEGLPTLATPELLSAVAEGVLAQRRRVLERLATSLADRLLRVRVGDGVAGEVGFGEEGGATYRADEPLPRLPRPRVLELLVEPQIVLLGARKPT